MKRPLLHALAKADNHGCRGIHADLVCGLHDIHPFPPGAFETADFAAGPVIQNFRSAPGKGIQTCSMNLADHLLQRQTGYFNHFHNLRRGEGVHGDLRETLLNSAQ
ncbi:hypothetical protein D3C74_397670 [compost metagenome]